MSPRARRPTDDVVTEIRAPGFTDQRGPAVEAFEDAATRAPIRVISMKDPAAEQPRAELARAPLHVQLRALAEVAGRNDTPVHLGHLAPPRDPREARARRRRDNVVWACVAIGLACAIAIAVWLVAGR